MEKLSWQDQSGFARFKEWLLQEIADDSDGDTAGEEIFLQLTHAAHDFIAPEKLIDPNSNAMNYSYEVADYYYKILSPALNAATDFDTFVMILVARRKRKHDIGLAKSIAIELYHLRMEHERF